MASKSGTVVKLFMKPSQSLKHTAHTTPGSCPICQEWFMALYCLSKEFGLFEFTAELVADVPSEEWSKLAVSKPPAILVLKGSAPNGEDLTNMVFSDLDQFLEVWGCEGFMPPRHSKVQEKAEKAFLNLYGNFNAFLFDSKDNDTNIRKSLQMLNTYLEENKTKYLMSDQLCYADCTLIPKLHHLKIASEAYKDFRVPLEYKFVWRYLKHAYESPAFSESCPFDEDIILLYNRKASCPPKIKLHTRDLHQTRVVPKEVMDGDNGHDGHDVQVACDI